MSFVLRLYNYDKDELMHRRRQVIGGDVNNKLFYGFVFTDSDGKNSFIFDLINTDYYKRSIEFGSNICTDKSYVNPDFNEFKYIVMEILDGNNSDEVFKSFYYGLMTQTVGMNVKFKASELMVKLRLSTPDGHLRFNRDWKLIDDAILSNLICSDKDAMLEDIFNSIQVILEKTINNKFDDSKLNNDILY